MMQQPHMMQQQTGGAKNISRPYKKEYNAPNISHDQKEVYNKTKREKPIEKGPAILAEQKIYDVAQKKQKPELRPIYPPAYIPVGNPYYPLLNPEYAYGYKPNRIPVQKIYNVSLSNPAGDHSGLARVFEDSLPGGPHGLSYNSIQERLALITFIKHSIGGTNGDRFAITPNTDANSLLSWIKLLEINPYTANNNPYTDMSDRMLLYYAAYPIRYNTNTTLTLGKPSTGVNVRIYEMGQSELNAASTSHNITAYDFNLFRELKYYEYIKQKILKLKISPNFINIILYKLDLTSNINYEKLRQIKYGQNYLKNSTMKVKTILPKPINNSIDNVEVFKFIKKLIVLLDSIKIVKVHLQLQLNPQLTLINKLNAAQTVIEHCLHNNNSIKSTNDPIVMQPLRILYNVCPQLNNRVNELDYKDNLEIIKQLLDHIINGTAIAIPILINMLLDESKASLVALTEAPTNNIIIWGQPEYTKFGSVNKMTRTGIHKKEIWRSVIFQLIYSIAVLQQEGIYFKNFSLKNNVFIKDVVYTPNNLGHWRYKIKNLEFFIPNHGYLVMIDTNYVNLADNNEYKIISKIFGKDYIGKDDNGNKIGYGNGTVYDENNVNEYFRKMWNKTFKKIMAPDNFKNQFSKPTEPSTIPQEIYHLLTNIKQSIADQELNRSTEWNIKDVLEDVFISYYLHPRVGTALRQSEYKLLSEIERPKFYEGELVVYNPRWRTYIWSIIHKINLRTRDCNIITINNANDEIVRKNVRKNALFTYPKHEMVASVRDLLEQSIKKDSTNLKLDDEHLIEIYTSD